MLVDPVESLLSKIFAYVIFLGAFCEGFLGITAFASSSIMLHVSTIFFR